MISVKRLNSRRLTELFDQLPKSISSFLAVDQIFFKAKNTIIRTFDQLPKSISSFWQLIESFLKLKIPLLEISIN
jgi:hypothetical protein